MTNTTVTQKMIFVEDDSIQAHVFIKKYLQYLDLETLQPPKNLRETIENLTQGNENLIFLDIAMPDGERIDILPYVDRQIPIIFNTSHGTYSVKISKIDFIDQLLPSFTRKEHAVRDNEETERSAVVNKKQKEPEQILIKSCKDYRLVKPSDILSVISIGGNYTSVSYSEEQSDIARMTLKEWEQTLPNDNFLRIHRSGIINTSKITNLTNKEDGYFVSLDGINKPFLVSRRNVPALKKIMKG